MLDRPTLTKARATKQTAAASKETAPVVISGQTKPSLQRFLLKVDGQTKKSFPTFQAAEKIGLAIKMAHPIVQVSVYDPVEGKQAIIGSEKA